MRIRDQDKEFIKNGLEDYLRQMGIDARKPFKCLSPAHVDSRPSMRLDIRRRKAHCFSCGADYDTFDIIGIQHMVSGKNLFLKAAEIFGVGGESGKSRRAPAPAPAAGQQREPDFTEFFKSAHKRLGETAYLQKRGIGADVAARFTLGFASEWRHPKAPFAPASPRLIVPTGKSSYLARDTRESLTEEQKKYSKSKVGKVRLFNEGALSSACGPIFVTEGEIDALSVIEAGGEAVALGSAAYARMFASAVKEQKPAYPIILALDNDKAGKAASAELAKSLKGAGANFCAINPYGAHKDANEALTADRGAFLSSVTSAIQESMRAAAPPAESAAANSEGKAPDAQPSVARYLPDFRASVNLGGATAIPTGFERLDKALGGGLFEGLYVMGAISSLGKTALAMQIADQIAQAGGSALVFSLEMARGELMARSVSRHTLLEAMRGGSGSKGAKTARELASGGFGEGDRRLVDAAFNAYGEYAGNIYIFEGAGDIGAAEVRGAIEAHLKNAKKKPVAFVDYLQILALRSDRMTDKQNVDKSVIELKRASRDFGMPIIAISSFNRQGYSGPAAMEAFKESGAIEYSSDVLLGMQLIGADQKGFDANKRKRDCPREVELAVLKNRSGETGICVPFKYYPQHSFFKEA